MGGGGSSGSNYYENQDRLLGVQADVANNLYNQYAEYSPPAINAMAGMAEEAQRGDLGERLRSVARADASANATDALTSSLGGAQRSMERYGAGFNPTRVNANLTNAALSSAALRSSGLNAADAAASKYGEDQSWARNADLYSSLAGMPGTAVSALSSAAGGYGGMASDQTRLASAGAQGAGQFGSAVAYGLMRRDGGSVEHGMRFAEGGMPKLGDWRARQANVRIAEPPSPMMSAVQGAAPTVAMELGRSYLKDGVAGVIGSQPAAPIVEAVATPVSQLGSVAPAAEIAGAGEAAGAGAAAAEAAGTAAAAGEVAGGAAAAGEAAAAAAAAEAAAAGTAATAGGGMAALGTAVPWIGAGYLAGTALGLWADGGPVPHENPHGGLRRRNLDTGGPINGPGTETSDSIPALVSDGEYILNAEAVKLVGKKKLDAMNARGLKVRGKKTKGSRKYAEGGNVEPAPTEAAAPDFFGAQDSQGAGQAQDMSIAVDFGNGQTDIPLLVPTLAPEEVQYLLSGGAPTHEIATKAVAHAQQRIAAGMSPFMQQGEKVQPAPVQPAPRMQGMAVPPRTMQPQMQGAPR